MTFAEQFISAVKAMKEVAEAEGITIDQAIKIANMVSEPSEETIYVVGFTQSPFIYSCMCYG